MNKMYQEPIREYDKNLKADQDYINTLPDLQNGPSSSIEGANVKLHHVGIHNFRLPLKYTTIDEDVLELETKVTGLVSLEAEKKGINMSRIIRSFYDYKDDTFSINMVEDVLRSYIKKLGTFEAKILLKFSYPMLQKSLRSGLSGHQYYDVVFEVDLDKDEQITKVIHFYYVYSSACPCSYELGQHAIKNRNRAIVSHSQRSVAKISLKLDDGFLWLEEIKNYCDEALKTETQVMVKREDEQAFAELNGAHLKFVEDASRLLYEQFDGEGRVQDFKIVCSHLESLHSHDAVGVVVKGVKGGFQPDVNLETFESLIR